MSIPTETIRTLRQSPESPNFISEDAAREPGVTYYEYTELWEHHFPTEEHPLGKAGKMLERKATGRSFVYVDAIAPELYDDDPIVKKITDRDYVCWLTPHDFMIHRFKLVK